MLHTLIGIGNNITKYLEHFIVQHMEKYTEKERALKNSVPLYEAMWHEAGERVKVWDASKDGKSSKNQNQQSSSKACSCCIKGTLFWP